MISKVPWCSTLLTWINECAERQRCTTHRHCQATGCDNRSSLNIRLTCRSAFYHIPAYMHIRASLSTDRARTIASVLVNSRLNYTNSVLNNTSSKRVEHIHLVLHQFHCLLINYRTNYKVETQAYKVRSTGSPAYLLHSVSEFSPTRNLRSSS